MKEKSILVIGSFHNPQNKKHATTAAEQLAALLLKNNVQVITATRQYKKLYKLVATVYAIISNCRRFRIAIVPLYGTPMSFIWQHVSVVLLKLLRKKVVLIVHGGSIPKQAGQGDNKFIAAMHRADIVVCPSAYMQQFLKDFGIRSLVIENSLDISVYPFQHKTIFRPHILWMRSFSDIYNPEMAVRVAVILAKKYPFFKMVMAGTDGGTLEQTKKMISVCGLQRKILMPGYLQHRDKLKYAAEFDIYICTNRIDNAPVTIIEYMALGLVTVSVNSGGIPFMVKDGWNGWLVNSDDAEAMAAAIFSVIDNPVLSQKLCKNANVYAQQYNQQSVYAKWQSLFEQLN